MNKDELNDYIENMSYDERMKLTQLYLAPDIKVKDIIIQENLPILSGQFRKLLLPLPTDGKCPYCGVTLVAYPSRDRYTANDAYCPRCKHRSKDYRDKRISRSALGLYYYDKILGLGDKAHELPVREESLNIE